jgi:hypothetical protein
MYDGIWTCARCDEPIMPDDFYVTQTVDAGSGPGATVVLHEVLCRRVLIQTAPVSEAGLIQA